MRTWAEDVRAYVRYHEAGAALLKRFPRVRDAAPLSGADASTVIDAVAGAADVDLKHFPLPDAPQDEALEDVPGWTAGRVRACLAAIAAVNPDDPAELLQLAQEYEERRLRLARINAERMERDLGWMRRERLLPKAETLEKVSRYEAHLSRELSKALRESQELQDRRQPHPPTERVGVWETLVLGIAERSPLPAGTERTNCETNSPALPALMSGAPAGAA